MFRLMFFLLGCAFYFLPTIIGRHKANAGAIFILNLLLGWTVIGWVVALVWALSGEARQIARTPFASTSAAPPAARYCTSCGSWMGADARFCSGCGHPVR